jgi:hypothetical protein
VKYLSPSSSSLSLFLSFSVEIHTRYHNSVCTTFKDEEESHKVGEEKKGKENFYRHIYEERK